MTRLKLCIETAGDGPDVVLTHGLGDTMSTWDRLWPHLIRSSTVTRWDLRGHGGSDAPADPADYDPEQAVDDLMGIIAGRGTPVTLIGHSLGGYLSVAVAMRAPNMVNALIMISSGPGYRDPVSRQRWNDYVDEVVKDMPVPDVAGGLAHQHDSSVLDGLPTLECPLVQIVGERDVRFHAGVRHVESKVPTATSHHIASAGHHPQRTHPELVLAALGLDR